MKTISRAVMRGKPLDDDCRTAHISKDEYGPNDNRCFCYGLYVPCNDWEIQQKCRECKAYVDNAEPLKDCDTDNNVRNLTDEETAIYESWIESEAKDTGVNIMDGDAK